VTDLLDLTAELVDIPSVSKDEAAITDWIEARLRGGAPWLEVTRVGNNLVARTQFDRGLRVMLAGHTDTVPVNANDRARIEGDTLWGLGSSDMKSGLAVALDLACSIEEPALDVTYLFYECEEIDLRFNGLRKLLNERPDLLACDAAILGEPTDGLVEAGCQGSIRVALRASGARAHTARPWMGRNAIHRLAPVLDALAAYEERRPVLNRCEFREALQAVAVSGGVAGNVVPDIAELVVNHRFAPDRTSAEAVEHVRSILCGAVAGGFDDSADEFEVLDEATAAAPDLDHPVLAALVSASGAPPRAKLGWTDVAFFAAAGVPATNFGPGDPTLAHTRDERVERAPVERVHDALSKLLTGGIAGG
jgi:succinyl-diaminopimelate desuccinylase